MGRLRRRFGRRGLFVLGTALLGAAIAVSALGAAYETGHLSGDPKPAPTLTPTVTRTPTRTLAPTLTPTNTPVPVNMSPVGRLIIPSIGVNAPVQVKTVDRRGVMQAPDGAYQVAWYSFGSRPGAGGNVIFAGHVDYVGVGPAVFYRLDQLGAGSIVEVHLADGSTYRYRVVSNQSYYNATAPIADIVGQTPTESVTLITCGGTFNYSTREYDRRVVVRGERVP